MMRSKTFLLGLLAGCIVTFLLYQSRWALRDKVFHPVSTSIIERTQDFLRAGSQDAEDTGQVVSDQPDTSSLDYAPVGKWKISFADGSELYYALYRDHHCEEINRKTYDSLVIFRKETATEPVKAYQDIVESLKGLFEGKTSVVLPEGQ